MKSGFKDRAAIKKQMPEDKPKDGGKALGMDFRCPQYDQRSSCFVNAGTYYGKGVNQPIGHSGDAKMDAECLPFGRVNTMRTNLHEAYE
jgi:hypothetical protein